MTEPRLQFEAEVRGRLANAADRVPAWRALLREQAFDAQLVEDDWLGQRCRADELAEHEQYLGNFWREVLLRGNPSGIMYGDEPACDSEFINKLKQRRLARFGTVESLFSNPRTRPQIELTAAGRLLAKVNERMTDEDVYQFGWRQREAAARIARGRKRYASDVASLLPKLNGVESSEEKLVQSFIDSLQCALASTPAREGEICQLKRAHRALFIPASTDFALCILPLAQPRDAISGSVSLAWRVSRQRHVDIDAPRVVIHMDEILPFGRYHHFDSAEQLAFNLIAHQALVRAVVPDLIATLRGPLH